MSKSKSKNQSRGDEALKETMEFKPCVQADVKSQATLEKTVGECEAATG